MSAKEEVILVNTFDDVLGYMEKMEAHRRGLLHRAFSIFIFNEKGELLLQKRAPEKYHSGGLWTNTCCSHPRKGESVLSAANRRLKEEMGMEVELSTQFHFIYKSSLDHGLIEHELDHVLFGTSEQEPVLNKEEVQDWKYMTISNLQKELSENPELYTAWFKICFDEVVSKVPAQ